jgi:signal peptidase I
MSPSILIGDHFFVTKTAYGWIDHDLPARGDVIAFPLPERPEQEFIKRVVGLPGDRLLLKGVDVYINGWKVPSCPAGRATVGHGNDAHEGDLVVEYLGDRTYLIFHDQRMRPYGSDDEQGPYDVAPDQVFVLGDNRENSYDSRGWFEGRGGGVPRGHIKGRASVIWMSFAPNGIAWSRVGMSLVDAPACAEPFSPETCRAIARCVLQRPPVSATTPPNVGDVKR